MPWFYNLMRACRLRARRSIRARILPEGDPQLVDRVRTRNAPRRALVRGAGLVLCLAFPLLSFPAAGPQANQNKTADKKGSAPAFANMAPGVEYVGSKTCGSCHTEIFSNFQQTGMGRSMIPAGGNALPGLPAPVTVFDQDLGQYFEVFRKDGSWYESQYALDTSGKELYRQTLKMDYVVGAGDNGLGFAVQRGLYLFEAPLSYYTKSRTWSFSPGYEFHNQAFTRPIVTKCIGCHSGRPNPVYGQIGLYKDPPFDELAVGCENCHGPGGLHVKERRQEQMMGISPSEAADMTIVNPTRLSGWLADNICMRCHQGDDVRVDRPGTEEKDFRPGMELDKVISIFKIAPDPQTPPSKLLLEHYFGMTLSKCYRATSGGLHCISCHDPHVQLSGQAAFDHYRARCLKCHNDQSCTLSREKRLATTPPDDCVGCHMPRRTVATISHAALTDHTIPAKAPSEIRMASPAGSSTELLHLSAPFGERGDLQAVPSAVLAQAYEALVHGNHPEFQPKLDQLVSELSRTSTSDAAVLRILARHAALQDTPEARQRAVRYVLRIMQGGSPNVDDYTLLAELYLREGKNEEAIKLLEKARVANPYFPSIYEALAAQYMTVGDYRHATALLQKGLELFPDDAKLRMLDKTARSATLEGP